MYGRNIEDKALEFFQDVVPYLDSHELKDLLDNLDLDYIIDYVEYSDKFRVISADEFEEYRYLKNAGILEEEDPDMEKLDDIKRKLNTILQFTIPLSTELNQINNSLEIKYEEIVNIIKDEDNSIK